MQDKLKNILKKFSFGNADPDKDWKKVFGIFTGLMVVATVWSFYFYYGIQSEIAAAEASQPVASGSGTVGEDKLKGTIAAFTEKAAKNSSVLSGSTSVMPAFMLEDPSRP